MKNLKLINLLLIVATSLLLVNCTTDPIPGPRREMMELMESMESQEPPNVQHVTMWRNRKKSMHLIYSRVIIMKIWIMMTDLCRNTGTAVLVQHVIPVTGSLTMLR